MDTEAADQRITEPAENRILMRSACSSPVPKITYTPARDITMPIAFFHVILSFKNIAAITEIATGFKEFIREESDPDNLAVPASFSIIAAKYPKPPRIIKYGQCSF